jgi:ABC-type sugar transport system substrate-binding protein
MFRIALSRWISVALLAVAPAGCGKEATKPADAATAASAPTRIGLSLVDASDSRAAALKAAAQAARVDLRVQCANGLFAAQSSQVLALLDEKVTALLLVPSSPDLLHEMAMLVASKSVPLITIGRGDGSVGAWVGVKSETLARETGEAVARTLRQAGVTRPRLVTIESSRWPETKRRNEAVLSALQKEFGSLDLPIRLHDCETEVETLELLLEGLPRLVSVDAILAAEPATTAAAWASVQRVAGMAKTLVAGVTDDDKLATVARADGSRLVLVCWKPSDLATKAVDAALHAAGGGAKGSADEVATELVGVGTGPR